MKKKCILLAYVALSFGILGFTLAQQKNITTNAQATEPVSIIKSLLDGSRNNIETDDVIFQYPGNKAYGDTVVTLSKDGTLKIKGTGAFYVDSIKVSTNTDIIPIKTLVIEEGITQILSEIQLPKYYSELSTTLEKIIVPDSLKLLTLNSFEFYTTNDVTITTSDNDILLYSNKNALNLSWFLANQLDCHLISTGKTSSEYGVGYLQYQLKGVEYPVTLHRMDYRIYFPADVVDCTLALLEQSGQIFSIKNITVADDTLYLDCDGTLPKSICDMILYNVQAVFPDITKIQIQ